MAGWISVSAALLALHVLGNVVWIGALLAVTTLAGRARMMADVAEIGQLARRVYLRLAVPAFWRASARGWRAS
jgi:putative copper export protein